MKFLKLFENFFLNESKLVFSDNLRSILKKVDSPVAQKLLDLEENGGDELTITNNYFDIGENKDKVYYTTDRKAQEILNTPESKKPVVHIGGGFLRHSDANAEIFRELDYTPEGENTYHPQPNEEGLIIANTTAPSGKIYCKVQFPGGISVINNQSLKFVDLTKLPFKKSRQPGRVGAIFQTLIRQAGGDLTNDERNDFVNKYGAQFDVFNDAFRNFELVSGDDIHYWYQYQNYLHKRDKGQLSNSCMSSASTRWLQIYTQNPDVCQLLILKDDDNQDKIKGRALVWKLTEPEGVTYVDRIYTHDDTDLELFKDYISKQKWHLKKRYTSSTEDTTMIDPDGNEVRPSNLTVKVQAKDYDGYPYLDTLKWYTPRTGKLSTDSSGEYELQDTGGGRSNEDCDYCGGSGVRDCYECEGSGREDCDNCDGNGSYDCSDCSETGYTGCSECDGRGERDCPTCDGSGGDASSSPCPDCDGSGRLECEDCEGDGRVECSDCDGEGFITCDVCRNGRVDCHYCEGSGEISCPDCG